MASFVMDFRFSNINLIPFINWIEKGGKCVCKRVKKCVLNGIDILSFFPVKFLKPRSFFYVHHRKRNDVKNLEENY